MFHWSRNTKVFSGVVMNPSWRGGACSENWIQKNRNTESQDTCWGGNSCLNALCKALPYLVQGKHGSHWQLQSCCLDPLLPTLLLQKMHFFAVAFTPGAGCYLLLPWKEQAGRNLCRQLQEFVSSRHLWQGKKMSVWPSPGSGLIQLPLLWYPFRR